MISRDTVIVLGAGASSEYGFPSGAELKRQVLAPHVHQALMAAGYHRDHVDSFQQSLKRAGQASIDAFLEHRPDFLDIGKYAIAHVLVPCETAARLFEHAPDNLYEYLFAALNAPSAKFDQNRLTVVTFNYDRSFEYYLREAVRNKYNVSEEKAAALAGTVRVIHVHGQLGTLDQLSYGGMVSPTRVRLAAEGIHVIHEHVPPTDSLAEARSRVAKASCLVFLGFGYHRVNLERLGVAPRENGFGTFGSAYGLTRVEMQAIGKVFESRIGWGASDHRCVQFLRNTLILDE